MTVAAGNEAKSWGMKAIANLEAMKAKGILSEYDENGLNQLKAHVQSL